MYKGMTDPTVSIKSVFMKEDQDILGILLLLGFFVWFFN